MNVQIGGMMIKILLALVFMTNVAFAECPKNVQPLKKGEVANCDGFLFSPETEQKAANAIDDAKYYKELNVRLFKRKELTDKEINILDKRLELYIKQSEVTALELNRKRSEDKWQKIIWFSLGVLATGIAVHGAGQLR